nr:BamA/TamA family outer membrane protein [Kofleriaceae bacterium]
MRQLVVGAVVGVWIAASAVARADGSGAGSGVTPTTDADALGSADALGPDTSQPPPGPDASQPPDGSDDGGSDDGGDALDEPDVHGGELHEDNEYGPLISIDSIDITGNTATDTEIIRRALPIAVGDVLHSSDHRLRDARYKVLALGYFRDVTVAMHKAVARGHVLVEVHVVERGTTVLNRLWFGTTDVSPAWVGVDVAERNLLGLGVTVGGGLIYAAPGDIPGGREQWAGELRIADGSLRGTPWGINGSLTLVHGSEPFRTTGGFDDNAATNFEAFDYRRFGGRFGATYDISALSRISAGLRLEEIDADLPAAPTQSLPDGRVTGVDLGLLPGSSRVVTLSAGFDRDTRPDPTLPHSGDRITVAAELGTAAIGSSYDYVTLFGRYEHWWPLRHEHQTIGVRIAGGFVLGDAPRFDRIYVGDVDPMLTPRALGLVLSTAPPIDFLGTRADKPTYGDLGGTATVEYAVQLFRGKGRNRVYGADVFLGAGLWALAETSDLHERDAGVYGSLPVDLFFNGGIRLDTDVGVFELTIANALGRLR